MFIRLNCTRRCRILFGPALRAGVFVCAAVILSYSLLSPLSAHHAKPEYDSNSQISITGTVKEFELINPHAWIHLVVTTRDGEIENWSFEGDSVGRLTRVGWTRDLLKPGDVVEVLFNPRRDGRPGGAFRGVTTAEGEFHSASRRRTVVRF
jgi:hypothetical protein